jgi:hypothetical protein
MKSKFLLLWIEEFGNWYPAMAKLDLADVLENFDTESFILQLP